MNDLIFYFDYIFPKTKQNKQNKLPVNIHQVGNFQKKKIRSMFQLLKQSLSIYLQLNSLKKIFLKNLLCFKCNLKNASNYIWIDLGSRGLVQNPRPDRRDGPERSAGHRGSHHSTSVKLGTTQARWQTHLILFQIYNKKYVHWPNGYFLSYQLSL